MVRFCDKCNNIVETKIVEKKESYNAYGKHLVEVAAKVLACAECGEELFCEKLDNDTLRNVYKKCQELYKEKDTTEK